MKFNVPIHVRILARAQAEYLTHEQTLTLPDLRHDGRRNWERLGTAGLFYSSRKGRMVPASLNRTLHFIAMIVCKVQSTHCLRSRATWCRSQDSVALMGTEYVIYIVSTLSEMPTYFKNIVLLYNSFNYNYINYNVKGGGGVGLPSFG